MAVRADEALPSVRIEYRKPLSKAQLEILGEDALAFLADLHRQFNHRRRQRLDARQLVQAEHDRGVLPDFRTDTRELRESAWRVTGLPQALRDRRVEITGPVERKMVINGLNSGARVFMADFEDSTTPRFDLLLDGQINLRDAVAGTIEHSANGKHYRLNAETALLMVRPRGWHLPERHVTVRGESMSAALFDFGLFAWHNAGRLHAKGKGLYLYLPKLESMEEAALWDDVIGFVEQRLGLPEASIKVTVLIETLPAMLQMDEILYALRKRIAALNCGRWDYIFSYLKTFRAQRDRLLPERAQVGMSVPFLRRYSQLLIRTCHRRGALAMGGMAAQIPIRDDEAANTQALQRVRADKQREAGDGHDGTWVAHPALVPVAMQEFDAVMHGPNQLCRDLPDLEINRDELIEPCAGSISRAGFDNNVEVALRYTAAWLDGLGCVPIHHLMEDAATAEIARSQLWQWLHPGGRQSAPAPTLTDHSAIEPALFDHALAHHRSQLADSNLPGATRADAAADLLAELTHADQLADFLTLHAYQQLD